MYNRKICGVAYNSGGKHKAKVNKRNTYVYQIWRDMIRRCLGNKQNTYTDCKIDDYFLNFQNFAEWATVQIGFGIKDYHMDKDILSGDNKVYSPSTVVFIPKDLNIFLTNSKAARGKYPQGVSFKKSHGRYCAQIKKFGVVHHLGLFNSVEEAALVYKEAKELAAKEWLALILKNKIVVDPRVIEWLENFKFEEK